MPAPGGLQQEAPPFACSVAPQAGREVALVKVVTTIGRPGVAVTAITRRPSGFVVAHVDGAKPPLSMEPDPERSRHPQERGLAGIGRHPDAVRASLTRQGPGSQPCERLLVLGSERPFWFMIGRGCSSARCPSCSRSCMPPGSLNWACFSGWTTSSTFARHHAAGLDERIVIVDIDEKSLGGSADGLGPATGWLSSPGELFERRRHRWQDLMSSSPNRMTVPASTSAGKLAKTVEKAMAGFRKGRSARRKPGSRRPVRPQPSGTPCRAGLLLHK